MDDEHNASRLIADEWSRPAATDGVERAGVAGHALPPADAAPGPRLLWRWFRLAGVPLIALTVITTAIIVLRAPSPGADSVALDRDARGDAGAALAPVEGREAPDFVLQTAAGGSYRLSDLGERPVLLNFWATWCGPCRQEMPAIEEEYRARAGEGLVVLAINVREAPRTVQGFARRLGLSFPVLLDESGEVSDHYRVRSLPTTFFITPEGIMDGSRTGAYSRRLLSDRLDQFLERP